MVCTQVTICFIIGFIFAVLGVQLLRGRMFRCFNYMNNTVISVETEAT